jgi:hypothetical protein
MAASAPPRIHPVRIALLAGAAITTIGTFLPWLVGVPAGLLDLGDGTILGITTIHGAVVLAAMAGVAALALRRPRNERLGRGRLAGAIGLALLSVVVAAFVLGTSKEEIYDAIDAAAPSKEVADHLVVEAAKHLADFEMGVGAYPVTAGLALIVVVALVAIILPRRR